MPLYVIFLFFICIALIFSAVFSGIETAIIGASKARIHKLKTDGNKKAALVSDLRENKEKVLGAILLANNIFNILEHQGFSLLQ